MNGTDAFFRKRYIVVSEKKERVFIHISGEGGICRLV